MSAGDVTLAQCFGFPALARATGNYWTAGNFGGLAGSGVVGIRADINSPVTEWRRDGYYYGSESQIPKEIGLLPPTQSFTWDTDYDWLGSYRLLAGAWVGGQTFPVRQRGWTKGIYTHFVGDVIRRRTGPNAADCTYWRCKLRTDQFRNISGENKIGNDGRDPALPEMSSWWEVTTAPSPESNCVNSYIAVTERFQDRPQMFVGYDCKVVNGWVLRIVADESIDAADPLALTFANQPTIAYEGVAQNPWVFDTAFTLPYPEPLRGIIIATYNGTTNRWTHASPTSFPPYNQYRTGAFNLTSIPKGFLVTTTEAVYRALETVPYPPATAPSADARFQELDRARYSLQDHNLPNPQPKAVYVRGQFGNIYTFTRPYRYARMVAQSQLRSLWPSELNINTPFATVTEEIRTGCSGTAWPTRPVEKIATLSQHPLLPPDAAQIVKSGKVGHLKYYLKYNFVGDQVLQKIEWVGDCTEFIWPGQHMDVELWVWDPYERQGNVRQHLRAGFTHDQTYRYWAALPSFYPLPTRSNFTEVASQRTYAHPAYFLQHDLAQSEPVWIWSNPASITGISVGSGAFTLDVVDDRQLTEAAEFIWPNRPGYDTRGKISPRSGQILHVQSIENQQTLYYSQTLRWGLIRAHADADVTRQILVGGQIELTLPPMLVCRQRLNLYEQVSCT